MKILWICNIVFPEATLLLTGESTQKSSGGWLLNSAELISASDDIELYVASISHLVKDLTFLKGRKITYALIPYGRGFLKYNPEYETYWKKIKNTINPEIIHIHGTEFSHGIAYLKACGSDNVVLSIQGIMSEIAKYYNAGLTKKELRTRSIHDILKGSGLIQEQKEYYNRSAWEKEMISNIGYIIGRTLWDKAHVLSINPNIRYFKCNETLRAEFYSGRWDYGDCVKHSIFISQGAYPVKGLHIFLKAMPLIIEKYPDTQVRIAGEIISSSMTFSQRMREHSYSLLIRKIIRDNAIGTHINFLGPLSSEEMKEEYLRTNVFVSPSTIENSPNSLGEAQILGVPCVASFVGGVPDFAYRQELAKLYRFDDHEMLAFLICEQFSKEDQINNTFMIEEANRRHDPKLNFESTLNIYYKILENGRNCKS